MVQVDDKFNVLDYGYIILRGVLGNDQHIADIARASTQSKGKSTSLVTSLVRDRHTSPIEFGHIQVEIKMPLFVRSEWERHRTFTYSELSSRFGLLPEEYYVPIVERMNPQHDSNRQRSDENNVIQHADWARSIFENVPNHCQRWVNSLLDSGLVRELSQRLIPSTKYTVVVAQANLWNWMHFLELRLRNDAQWEIRQYAEVMRNIITELFPVAMAAFDEYIFEAVTFSRSDVDRLRCLIVYLMKDHYQPNPTPEELKRFFPFNQGFSKAEDWTTICQKLRLPV